MVHLGDSVVLWLMWLLSSLKASSSPSKSPPSPLSPATAWMRSQLHVDQAKCACGLLYTPCPDSDRLQESSNLSFWWKGLGSNVPCSSGAAAPGTRHSSAQKRREGQGLVAPLCRTHPVFFSSLCPLMRVFKCWLWLLFLLCVAEGLRLVLQAQLQYRHHLLCFYFVGVFSFCIPAFMQK